MFSIAFNLVSKLRSYPIAAIDTAGAEFILTVPDAGEIAFAVIVEDEVRLARVLTLV